MNPESNTNTKNNNDVNKKHHHHHQLIISDDYKSTRSICPSHLSPSTTEFSETKNHFAVPYTHREKKRLVMCLSLKVLLDHFEKTGFVSLPLDKLASHVSSHIAEAVQIMLPEENDAASPSASSSSSSSSSKKYCDEIQAIDPLEFLKELQKEFSMGPIASFSTPNGLFGWDRSHCPYSETMLRSKRFQQIHEAAVRKNPKFFRQAGIIVDQHQHQQQQQQDGNNNDNNGSSKKNATHLPLKTEFIPNPFRRGMMRFPPFSLVVTASKRDSHHNNNNHHNQHQNGDEYDPEENVLDQDASATSSRDVLLSVVPPCFRTSTLLSEKLNAEYFSFIQFICDPDALDARDNHDLQPEMTASSSTENNQNNNNSDDSDGDSLLGEHDDNNGYHGGAGGRRGDRGRRGGRGRRGNNNNPVQHQHKDSLFHAFIAKTSRGTHVVSVNNAISMLSRPYFDCTQTEAGQLINALLHEKKLVKLVTAGSGITLIGVPSTMCYPPYNGRPIRDGSGHVAEAEFKFAIRRIFGSESSMTLGELIPCLLELGWSNRPIRDKLLDASFLDSVLKSSKDKFTPHIIHCYTVRNQSFGYDKFENEFDQGNSALLRGGGGINNNNNNNTSNNNNNNKSDDATDEVLDYTTQRYFSSLCDALAPGEGMAKHALLNKMWQVYKWRDANQEEKFFGTLLDNKLIKIETITPSKDALCRPIGIVSIVKHPANHKIKQSYGTIPHPTDKRALHHFERMVNFPNMTKRLLKKECTFLVETLYYFRKCFHLPDGASFEGLGVPEDALLNYLVNQLETRVFESERECQKILKTLATQNFFFTKVVVLDPRKPQSHRVAPRGHTNNVYEYVEVHFHTVFIANVQAPAVGSTSAEAAVRQGKNITGLFFGVPHFENRPVVRDEGDAKNKINNKNNLPERSLSTTSTNLNMSSSSFAPTYEDFVAPPPQQFFAPPPIAHHEPQRRSRSNEKNQQQPFFFEPPQNMFFQPPPPQNNFVVTPDASLPHQHQQYQHHHQHTKRESRPPTTSGATSSPSVPQGWAQLVSSTSLGGANPATTSSVLSGNSNNHNNNNNPGKDHHHHRHREQRDYKTTTSTNNNKNINSVSVPTGWQNLISSASTSMSSSTASPISPNFIAPPAPPPSTITPPNTHLQHFNNNNNNVSVRRIILGNYPSNPISFPPPMWISQSTGEMVARPQSNKLLFAPPPFGLVRM